MTNDPTPPEGVRINTRDENGVMQPVDPGVEAAIRNAATALATKYGRPDPRFDPTPPTNADPITPEEIAELRRLHAAATCVPWWSDSLSRETGAVITSHKGWIAELCWRDLGTWPAEDGDLKLAIAARNALPRLLARIDALEAENRQMDAIAFDQADQLPSIEGALRTAMPGREGESIGAMAAALVAERDAAVARAERAEAVCRILVDARSGTGWVIGNVDHAARLAAAALSPKEPTDAT